MYTKLSLFYFSAAVIPCNDSISSVLPLSWDVLHHRSSMIYWRRLSFQERSWKILVGDQWLLESSWSTTRLFRNKPRNRTSTGSCNDQYTVVHSQIASQPQQEADGKTKIRIDYDLLYQVVYEYVSRLTLQEENSLDSFATAGSGRPGRSPLLPSWVPDRNNHPEEPFLISKFGPTGLPGYSVSLDTKPGLQGWQKSGEIEVEAYFVDFVLMKAGRYGGEDGVIATTTDFSFLGRRFVNLRKYILSHWWCFGVKFHGYPTGERPFEVFWRTMIANRVAPNVQKVVPSADFAESFFMAYPEILEIETAEDKPTCICPEWAIVESQQQHPQGTSHDAPGISSNGKNVMTDEQALRIRDKYPRPGELFGSTLPLYGEHYNRALHQAAIGRWFFRTHRGYVGIRPRNLSRNDHVVILKGGSLPFVVRQVGVCDLEQRPVYELLGEAYVHGLSDGEALQDFNDAERDSRWKKVALK